jgi:hypothetical protein
MNLKLSKNGSKFQLASVDSRALLDMIPMPAAIWHDPQAISALNKSAQQLIGFSEADLMQDNLLWSKRVYRGDTIAFAERQKKMSRLNSEVTCDYRFYPKGSNEPIWIREIAVSLSDPDLPCGWISTYSNISDLKQSQLAKGQELIGDELRDAISRLFHEIKNRLHLLNMELDLATLESGNSVDFKRMADALHAVNHSIKALQDCLVPSQMDPSSQD